MHGKHVERLRRRSQSKHSSIIIAVGIRLHVYYYDFFGKESFGLSMNERSGICCKNCFALDESVSLFPLLVLSELWVSMDDSLYRDEQGDVS